MGPMLCGLSVVIVIIVVYKLLDHILRLPRVGNYNDRYIFVTGCDSGFGHALVKRLDSLGCHVFAGCFTEKGETELKKVCSKRVYPVPIDVTNHDSVRNAYELVRDKLQSAGKGLWGVVNNAGAITALGLPEWMSIDDYRRQCDVNLFGLIDVASTFLPLVKKTRGRIVNMSSLAGRMALPVSAAYSLSKFGVEAFSDLLRRSMKPFGCKVAAVEPAFFQTSLIDNFQTLFERAWSQCSSEVKGEYASIYAKFKRVRDDTRSVVSVPTDLTPVVDAYEHALLARYPRPRYTVGALAAFGAFMAALPECVSDFLLDKIYRQ